MNQSFEDASDRDQALRARLGPAKYRARILSLSILLLAASALTYLWQATISSLNPGTGVTFRSQPETPATAQVHSCERRGPVSIDEGFGYWWHCVVTVETADGRRIQTTVGHSVVSPADKGKPVEFRESCREGKCYYGRPTPEIFKSLIVPANFLVGGLLVVMLAFASLVGLLQAVRSEPKSKNSD